MCRATVAVNDASWVCPAGHRFDIAREGYVNLLLGRTGRERGDSRDMVDARRRFLSTGAYDRVRAVVADGVARATVDGGPAVVLDVGCGEGYYTRALDAPVVAGIDVSKRAVAIAAASDRDGYYAVANASDLPVGTGGVDVALSVFGPVFPAELARVVRSGGTVVTAHPGRDHLAEVRSLVYADPQPHDVKPPLRGAPEWFARTGSVTVTFPVMVADATDLWLMTPYRWHAPPDIGERLASLVAVTVDVVITTYRREPGP